MGAGNLDPGPGPVLRPRGLAGRTHRLRDRTGRVQQRGRPRPPPGERPAQGAVSKPVNSLKGVSSRRLRQKFPDLVQHYWRTDNLWSRSYLAGSADGAPLPIVHPYIEQHNRPL
ncbi:transposase [Streptomyces sp. NPDC032161]|uniref:transposase n=1 Tax=unclassified Streptomyces TaxID=2593676 RepID=UPI00340B4107